MHFSTSSTLLLFYNHTTHGTFDKETDNFRQATNIAPITFQKVPFLCNMTNSQTNPLNIGATLAYDSPIFRGENTFVEFIFSIAQIPNCQTDSLVLDNPTILDLLM